MDRSRKQKILERATFQDRVGLGFIGVCGGLLLNVEVLLNCTFERCCNIMSSRR